MDSVEKYFESKAKDWVNDAYDISETVVPIGVQRINLVQEILGEFSNGKELGICDLGSGDGSLCRILADTGHNLTGIERSTGMIKMAISKDKNCQKKVNYIKSSIENASDKLEGKQFDVITSMGVLYYLNNENDFFTLAKKILKPGGIILVTCRNRLFNFFAGSKKREQELSKDDIRIFLEELFAINTDVQMTDIENVLTKLHELTSPQLIKSIQTRSIMEQAALYIREAVAVEGRQHTPNEFRQIAIANGFEVNQLYGVQPHFLSASTGNVNAQQILKKLSEALFPLTKLPLSLIWCSHFMAKVQL